MITLFHLYCKGELPAECLFFIAIQVSLARLGAELESALADIFARLGAGFGAALTDIFQTESRAEDARKPRRS